MSSFPFRGPFRIRGFWSLWFIGGLSSGAAGGLGSFGGTLLDTLDAPLRAIAGVGLSASVGLFLGLLTAGIVADRFAKQRIVRGCLLSLSLLAAVAVVLSFAGWISVPLIIVLACLFGILHGTVFASLLGWVGELLPRPLIAKGVVIYGWSGLGFGLISGGVAFVLLNLVLSEASVGWYYVYGCPLYAIATVLVARRSHIGPVRRHGAGLRAGVGYIRRDRRVRALWIYGLAAGGCASVFSTTLTLFAFTDLEVGLSGIPALYLAQGSAGLAASVALAFFVTGRQGWITLLFCGGVAATSCLAIAAIQSGHVLIVLLVPFGAATAAAGLAADALALAHTRFGYFGRVAAVTLLHGGIFGALTSFLSLAAIELLYGRIIIVGVGVILLILAAWLYSQWRQVNRLSEESNETASTPTGSLNSGVAAPQKSVESPNVTP